MYLCCITSIFSLQNPHRHPLAGPGPVHSLHWHVAHRAGVHWRDGEGARRPGALLPLPAHCRRDSRGAWGWRVDFPPAIYVVFFFFIYIYIFAITFFPVSVLSPFPTLPVLPCVQVLRFRSKPFHFEPVAPITDHFDSFPCRSEKELMEISLQLEARPNK